MTNIAFETVKVQENHDPMVDMADYPFEMAPMYFDWKLSDTKELWVRKAIADKMLGIQEKRLEPMGRKFKIWDPWRSRVVQNNIYQKFWDELSAENPDWDEEKLIHEVGVFVTKADQPERIPPHATGGSIDLTVIDENGEEVDFGTVFDHFGPEAATEYFEESSRDVAIRDNRRWLQKIMLESGFGNDVDEWWHFDYGNQKWALLLGHNHAVYGEVIDPIEFNKTISLKKMR